MKRLNKVGAVTMLASVCLSSEASVLPPGRSGATPGATPGPVPLEELTTPYSSGGISGTITSWVARNPNNPLGGFSFYYQVNNTGSKKVSHLSIANFGVTPGASVNVQRILMPFAGSLPGGDAPTVATRSPGAGSVVGFGFNGAAQINGGQHSEILVVNTACQTFQIVSGTITCNSSFNVNVLGPCVPVVPSAVPEPSTLISGSLLLIPLGASALRIICKRKQKITGNSIHAIEI